MTQGTQDREQPQVGRQQSQQRREERPARRARQARSQGGRLSPALALLGCPGLIPALCVRGAA